VERIVTYVLLLCSTQVPVVAQFFVSDVPVQQRYIRNEEQEISYSATINVMVITKKESFKLRDTR